MCLMVARRHADGSPRDRNWAQDHYNVSLTLKLLTVGQTPSHRIPSYLYRTCTQASVIVADRWPPPERSHSAQFLQVEFLSRVKLRTGHFLTVSLDVSRLIGHYFLVLPSSA